MYAYANIINRGKIYIKRPSALNLNKYLEPMAKNILKAGMPN